MMISKKELTEEQKKECAQLKAIYLEKRNKLKINQQDLADSIDSGQAAVSHYMNGVNPLNLRVASAFSNILQVPVSGFSPRLANEMSIMSSHELLYNTANLLPESDKEKQIPIYTPSEVIRMVALKNKFPLISWVSAGAWTEAIEPYNIHDIDEWPSTTKKASDNSFWLRVKGNSMTSPTGLSIPEGMLILVDPSVEVKSNKLVIAKLENDNEATFKKYVEDAGRKYLVGLNPSWPIIEVNGNCTIIGVVIEAKWDL